MVHGTKCAESRVDGTFLRKTDYSNSAQCSSNGAKDSHISLEALSFSEMVGSEAVPLVLYELTQ